MTALQFELRTDGIAVLRMDVPNRPMNVLTAELVDALSIAVDRIASNAEITGAVLTSGKPGSFVAGADLRDFVTLYDRGITPQQARDISWALSSLFRRLETCGKPLVAAINGLALGGGLELALACHHRILIDDPKAVVGLPEVKVGLLPGAGGTQRLPRRIGIANALPLLLEGRHVKPAEALQLGIVDALAPADDVLDVALAWLTGRPQPIAPWDRKGFTVPGGAGPLAAPVRDGLAAATAAVLARNGRNEPAPLAILSCVYEGTITSFEAGLRVESKYFGTLLSGPVARNRMRTMFIHKPALDKRAHRPAGLDGFCERIRRACTDEVIALLADGASPTLVENAARQAGLSLAHAPPADKSIAATSDESPTAEQVRERLLTIQALEAARQIDPGNILRADAADVASVFDAGYPAWTGGVLSYIDTLGLDVFVATCQRLAAKHGPRFAPGSALVERAAQGHRFHSLASA